MNAAIIMFASGTHTGTAVQGPPEQLSRPDRVEMNVVLRMRRTILGAGRRCTGIQIQPAEQLAHTDDCDSRCGPSEVARWLSRILRAQQPAGLGRCEKARLCRPDAPGAALGPGPARLDR